MSGPHDHEAVAALLREQPPALDELARARMEKAIVARRPATSAPAGARRSWVVGGALAVAAGLALFFLLREPTTEAPVARFEVRDVDTTAQRGTLEAGSVLSTGPDEIAEIRVADSEVRVEPESRLRIATVRDDALALELSEGEVRVGFHPRERGRERMTVTTPDARVEVVGTVFAVRARDGETRVSVTEGIVRVVPVRGGEARMIRAGESTVVDGAPVAASETAADALDGLDAIDEEPATSEREAVRPPEESSPRSVARAEPSPSAVLAEARRRLEEGRADLAEPLLRRVAVGQGSSRLRVDAWTLLGDLAQRSGRLPEAVTSYERAATLGVGTMAGANAIYALARLQDRRMHDAVAARRSYTRYLEAAPDGPLADQAGTALCRLGDAERCP